MDAHIIWPQKEQYWYVSEWYIEGGALLSQSGPYESEFEANLYKEKFKKNLPDIGTKFIVSFSGKDLSDD